MARGQQLSIKIICRCGETALGCLRVDRQVPPTMQCTPGGGGGGGADHRIRCGRCRQVCFEDIEHLRKAVHEIIRSPAWGRYMDDGYVPVPCTP